MIYSLKKQADAITVSTKTETYEVPDSFLKDHLKSYKYDEFVRDGFATVRDNWDLSQFKVLSRVESIVSPKKESHKTDQYRPYEPKRRVEQDIDEYKDCPRKFEKLYFENGRYQVDVSWKYCGELYELWALHKNGYYTFVTYFSNLSNVDALIDEHKRWQKFEKILTKNAYMSAAGKPDDKPVEDDDDV